MASALVKPDDKESATAFEKELAAVRKEGGIEVEDEDEGDDDEGEDEDDE